MGERIFPGDPLPEKGWGFLDGDPNLNTAAKRLAAIVEILGNGNRSLALLSGRNNDVREDFGLKARPVIEFGWQEFLERGVVPSEVLGHLSRRRPIPEGETVSTQYTRAIILLALKDGPKTATQLAQATCQPHLTVLSTYHLQPLDAAGILDYESIDSSGGQNVREYRLKFPQDPERSWPVFTIKEGLHPQPALSRITQEAVYSLFAQGAGVFSSRDVAEQGQKDNPKLKIHSWKITSCLNHFVDRGELVDSSGFGVKESSCARLTLIGDDIAGNILGPIVRWASNPKSAPEIYLNGNLNPDLNEQIRRAHHETSPFSNSDYRGKLAGVLRVIRNNQGGLTLADAARTAGLSSSYGSRVVKELIAHDQVEIRAEQNGRRRRSTLWAKDKRR